MRHLRHQDGLFRDRSLARFQHVPCGEIQPNHAHHSAASGPHCLDQFLVAAAEASTPVRTAQRFAKVDPFIHDMHSRRGRAGSPVEVRQSHQRTESAHFNAGWLTIAVVLVAGSLTRKLNRGG
jgi:hypothetical protein